MRRFFLFAAVVTVMLVFVGVAIGIGIYFAGSTHGMTVTIDGESFEGPLIAVVVGGAATLGVVLVGLIVVAVLASVAIVVPVLLVLVAVAALVALLAGLMPVAVPVLLLVGAYVLLSRRARRRASAVTAPQT